MYLKLVRLALLVVLGTFSTPLMAAANQDLGSFTPWSSPVNLGPPLSTSAEDSAPAISDDGLRLYFNRNPNLPGDNDEDLFVASRSRNGPWGDPVPLTTINTPPFNERNATLSRDMRLLFCSSDRPGGAGGLDLYVSRRTDRTDDQAWSAPVSLGPAVNSTGADVGPAYVEDEGG